MNFFQGFSPSQLAAIARLAGHYNIGKYDRITNPGGFDNDGHRVNHVPSMQDFGNVANAVGEASIGAGEAAIEADRFAALAAGAADMAGQQAVAALAEADRAKREADRASRIAGGNADSADKLYQARDIKMTGDVAWQVAFDGAGNVSAEATIKLPVLTARQTSETAYPPWRRVRVAESGDLVAGVLVEIGAPGLMLRLPAPASIAPGALVWIDKGELALGAITLARNGGLIAGRAEDLILDLDNTVLLLSWTGSTWKILSALTTG